MAPRLVKQCVGLEPHPTPAWPRAAPAPSRLPRGRAATRFRRARWPVARRRTRSVPAPARAPHAHGRIRQDGVARPARCNSRATPLGLPTCNTWSTAGKSRPDPGWTWPPRSGCCPSAQALFGAVAQRRVQRTMVQRASVAGVFRPRSIPARGAKARPARVFVNSGWPARPNSRLYARQLETSPDARPRAARRRCALRAARSTAAMRGRARHQCAAADASSNTSQASSRLPRWPTGQVRKAGDKRRRRARARCSSTPRLLLSSSCHSSTALNARKRDDASA